MKGDSSVGTQSVDILQTLSSLARESGIAQFLGNPLALVMVGIACLLIYLAIVKKFEPLLLLPIAFGMLLTNLLGSEVYHEALFAGGHANWSLFGGAILIDSPNLANLKELIDDVKEFSERACAKGGLNRVRGSDVMNIMMDLMNYAHKFGA